MQLHGMTQEHARLVHSMAATWHAQRLRCTAGSTLSIAGISSSSNDQGCGTMPSMSRQATRIGQESQHKARQNMGAASASSLPKLLVHLTSPVCHLPSECLSVFSVVNAAALSNSPRPSAGDAPAASSSPAVRPVLQAQQVQPSSQGRQMLQPMQLHSSSVLSSCQPREAQIQRAVVSQLVGSVVLPIIDQAAWQAAAAALKAAQMAQEKLEERQALALQHIAQVSGEETCPHVFACAGVLCIPAGRC